jgi:hypothetical protein
LREIAEEVVDPVAIVTTTDFCAPTAAKVTGAKTIDVVVFGAVVATGTGVADGEAVADAVGLGCGVGTTMTGVGVATTAGRLLPLPPPLPQAARPNTNNRLTGTILGLISISAMRSIHPRNERINKPTR